MVGVCFNGDKQPVLGGTMERTRRFEHFEVMLSMNTGHPPTAAVVLAQAGKYCGAYAHFYFEHHVGPKNGVIKSSSRMAEEQ